MNSKHTPNLRIGKVVWEIQYCIKGIVFKSYYSAAFLPLFIILYLYFVLLIFEMEETETSIIDEKLDQIGNEMQEEKEEEINDVNAIPADNVTDVHIEAENSIQDQRIEKTAESQHFQSDIGTTTMASNPTNNAFAF